LIFVVSFLQLGWIESDHTTSGILHGFLHFSNLYLLWQQQNIHFALLPEREGHFGVHKAVFTKANRIGGICCMFLVARCLRQDPKSEAPFDWSDEANVREYFVVSILARVPVVTLQLAEGFEAKFQFSRFDANLFQQLLAGCAGFVFIVVLAVVLMFNSLDEENKKHAFIAAITLQYFSLCASTYLANLKPGQLNYFHKRLKVWVMLVLGESVIQIVLQGSADTSELIAAALCSLMLCIFTCEVGDDVASYCRHGFTSQRISPGVQMLLTGVISYAIVLYGISIETLAAKIMELGRATKELQELRGEGREVEGGGGGGSVLDRSGTSGVESSAESSVEEAGERWRWRMLEEDNGSAGEAGGAGAVEVQMVMVEVTMLRDEVSDGSIYLANCLAVIVIGTIVQQLLQIAYYYLVVLVREEEEWQKQQRQPGDVASHEEPLDAMSDADGEGGGSRVKGESRGDERGGGRTMKVGKFTQSVAPSAEVQCYKRPTAAMTGIVAAGYSTVLVCGVWHSVIPHYMDVHDDAIDLHHVFLHHDLLLLATLTITMLLTRFGLRGAHLAEKNKQRSTGAQDGAGHSKDGAGHSKDGGGGRARLSFSSTSSPGFPGPAGRGGSTVAGGQSTDSKSGASQERRGKKLAEERHPSKADLWVDLRPVPAGSEKLEETQEEQEEEEEVQQQRRPSQLPPLKSENGMVTCAVAGEGIGVGAAGPDARGAMAALDY
jgi:hypothetical protein